MPLGRGEIRQTGSDVTVVASGSAACRNSKLAARAEGGGDFD